MYVAAAGRVFPCAKESWAAARAAKEMLSRPVSGRAGSLLPLIFEEEEEEEVCC